MKYTSARPLIWSGIYALLLLSLLTPFSIITLSLILIPGLMLFMLLDRVRFAIHYALVVIIVWLITGSFGLPIALISLFFIVPAVVMGTLYKKQTPARLTVMAGGGTILGQLLLLLMMTALLGPNPIEWIQEYMRESIATIPEAMRGELSDDLFEQAIAMMTRLIPLYLTFIAFWFAVITHTLGVRILHMSGVEVPRMQPVREWRLPQTLVWYYLAALVLDLFTDPASETLLVMVLWNLIPLLTFAFVVQAISFLFFVAHVKRWNKTLPIAGIVASLIMPGVVSLLGVIDMVFNLRKRMQKP